MDLLTVPRHLAERIARALAGEAEVGLGQARGAQDRHHDVLLWHHAVQRRQLRASRLRRGLGVGFGYSDVGATLS